MENSIPGLDTNLQKLKILVVKIIEKGREKTVGVSGIRTRIVGVQGKHTDHLTTTTAMFHYSLKGRGASKDRHLKKEFNKLSFKNM